MTWPRAILAVLAGLFVIGLIVDDDNGSDPKLLTYDTCHQATIMLRRGRK